MFTSSKKNQIFEFIIFYEHVDREYEVASILKNKLEDLSKKRGVLLSIIFERHFILKYKPELIVFPSLSWVEINYIFKLYNNKINIVSCWRIKNCFD